MLHTLQLPKIVAWWFYTKFSYIKRTVQTPDTSKKDHNQFNQNTVISRYLQEYWFGILSTSISFLNLMNGWNDGLCKIKHKVWYSFWDYLRFLDDINTYYFHLAKILVAFALNDLIWAIDLKESISKLLTRDTGITPEYRVVDLHTTSRKFPNYLTSKSMN